MTSPSVGRTSASGSSEGPTLRAARLRVERSGRAGVYVGGVGSRAELDDVLVREVASRPDGDSGQGVRAGGGAPLSLRDVAVVRATRIGVEAVGAGTTIEGKPM